MKYLVNVHTQNANDGCFSKSFNDLDAVRTFIKASVVSFKNVPCVATVLRNGDKLGNARVIAC